jgi:hypothetical protein
MYPRDVSGPTNTTAIVYQLLFVRLKHRQGFDDIAVGRRELVTGAVAQDDEVAR